MSAHQKGFGLNLKHRPHSRRADGPEPRKVWLRSLLAVLVVPLLTNCGTLPGPGPTSEQIAWRSRGVEIRTFKTEDDKELAYVVHRPEEYNARGAAFIYLHGIESHSGWFDVAAELLAARGYPVYSLDRRGSGLNRENRGYISGHVEKGIRLVDDIRQAVERARASGTINEIYLIGLSWGGKYVMAYDAAYPDAVDGMILITPGMKPSVDLSMSEKIAVMIDSVFSRTRQHRIPIEPEMFTTTPEHLDYIKNDPLKLHTASAAFLMQSRSMDKLVAKMDDIKRPPMLVFLAGKDRIIDNEATRKLVTRDPARRVTVIDYPDQTHSIQLDAPERLVADIVDWVETLPDR
jgi:alpha-beta hydrolase superfamily lysophospholipase